MPRGSAGRKSDRAAGHSQTPVGLASASTSRVALRDSFGCRTEAEHRMAILALGLVIFLGLHSTRIVAEGGRAKAIARIGEGPWKGVYSLLSAIGLVLIIWGFGQARYDAAVLWTAPVGVRHIALTLMLISLVLIAAYIFKKSHIAVAVHHPMVWGVAVWAAAHLFANGSAADLLLFGAFLVWAAADLVSSYARDRRDAVVYPSPEWGATIGAVVVGIVLWIALLAGLHLWLFGVSPLRI
jgi:uncharacterized membrane protein